jgi:hypothetical protein
MKYKYELSKGYRLYGQAWVPIREAIAYYLDLTDWIEIDTRRLTHILLKIAKLDDGPVKEDYTLIFLDLKTRLKEYSTRHLELQEFIGQSYNELTLLSTKADGIPRGQSHSGRGRRKGRH